MARLFVVIAVSGAIPDMALARQAGCAALFSAASGRCLAKMNCAPFGAATAAAVATARQCQAGHVVPDSAVAQVLAGFTTPFSLACCASARIKDISSAPSSLQD